MGMLAWIFGFLGGLCMVLGITTVTEVISPLGGFTWMAWFWLSTILFLITIAFAVGGGGGGEY